MPSIAILGDPPARAALKEALRAEPGIRMVGELEASSAAVERLRRLGAELVVLALAHGGDDGLGIAAQIMREAPRPIVAVGPGRLLQPRLVSRAKGLGVLEICPQLPSPASGEYEAQRAHLARLIRVFAHVPVVTRAGACARWTPPTVPAAPPLHPRRDHVELVVIGASTGGPPVLETILRALPRNFAIPIAVVQHMTAGFNRDFALWLEQVGGRKTVVVEDAILLEPGVLHLAAEDKHLVALSRTQMGSSRSAQRSFLRPSVDVLFESAAQAFGAHVLGVLLTGMGSDGVEGMAALRRCGAMTVAQTPQSCAVDSMPRGAIERAGVDVQADPVDIAALMGCCQP
ncbi:MAG: hypothetical protein HY901_36510 [Deltaproteobacteria bacterium]|nr:hypothetical protein [Deltaproteobacteria bacterium]